jgi:CheY-like chemotaxis protein
MIWRKRTSKTTTIVRRMSSAAADPLREPDESGGMTDSSLELLHGVRVSETPMDTLPGELIDEFFEDSKVHDEVDLPPDSGADDLTLTLRPIEESAAQSPAAQRPAELPELVRSDPDVAPEITPSAAKKAARRAAVRRARLATAVPESDATSGWSDLLLLDENDGTRKQLVRLLESFGFCVHSAKDIAQAGEMLAARPFAAVFLDIVLDGMYQSAEAELCRRVKRTPAPARGQAPALIIISEGARPIDRVRAALAGVDGFLLKPLSRGDVVRTLEDHGVRLPLDARRS